MLPSLLMYSVLRSGPRVKGFSHRLFFTTQLAWRTRPIRNTTSISDGWLAMIICPGRPRRSAP